MRLPAENSNDREQRLYAALADCVEALERDATADPKDLAAQNPEFRTELIQFLEGRNRLVELTGVLGPSANRRTNPSESTGAATPLGPPGTTVGGYELCEELGRGGMAVVYRARQIAANRFVALKTLAVTGGGSARRFKLEIEVVATLHHPHIVPIYDVGESDGRLFFTMRLLEGGSLAGALVQGRWPRGEHECWTRAAQTLASVARAVHHAHDHGVLHRDLKPANILLDADDRPFVADFGLARRTEIDGGLTQSGAVVGTPGYIAPEQALGRGLGLIQSDVYSLGAILYELLVGQRPFRAANPLETLLETIEREPIRPSVLVPALPRDLETVCLKCLESSVDQRYPSAEALAEDLERWLAGRSIRARRPGLLERASRWGRRHKALVWGIAFVVALGAITAAVTGLVVQKERAANAEATSRLESEARRALERQNYFRTVVLADRERAARNSGRAEQLLDQCPAFLRGWEWDYLRRLRQEPLPPVRYDGHLFCLALGAAGRLALVGGSDGSLGFYDVNLGDPNAVACAHDGQVRGVAISADGRSAASAGWDGRVCLWDVRTRQCLRSWKIGTTAFGVAFQPDGRVLAASDCASVHRWDLQSGEPLPALTGLSNVIRRIAFHPTRRELAAADDDGWIHVWDLDSGQTRLSFRGHSKMMFDVCYARNGEFLVTAGGQFYMQGESGQVDVWDSQTGQRVQSLRTSRGAIYAAVLTPDGQRLITGGEDAVIRIWDMATGTEALDLRGHGDAVWGLALSSDGRRLYSASGDHTLRVWDATLLTAGPGLERYAVTGHDDRVTSLAFSPDGRILATAGMDGQILIRNSANGVVRQSLSRSCGAVHGLAFSPNGDQLAVAAWRQFGDAAAGRLVSIWDTKTWTEMLHADLDAVGSLGVAYSPDGDRLIATADHGAISIDARSGKTLWRRSSPALVTAVACGPRAVAIAAADGSVTVVDENAQRIEHVLAAHRGRVFSVAFSPDRGLIATGGSDGAVRIWETDSWRERPAPAGHAGGAFSLAFTPDGRRLVSAGNDGAVRIWDVETGAQLIAIGGHSDSVHAVAVHPSGQSIASGGRDLSIRLWDLSFGSATIP